MAIDRKHQLQVLFTKEEREALKRFSERDGREEGPEVRWLVREYAAGRLLSAEQIEAQRLDANVRSMWKEMHQMMENITRLSARVTKGAMFDEDSNTTRDEADQPAGGKHLVNEIRSDESASEKSLPPPKPAK